jgi:hypothetical protein
MNNFVAVDFETSYAKDRDIKSLGTIPYLRHPETDIYLVSFAFPDGTTWAGDPAAAPWDRIKDCDFLSHNRAFDLCVHQELCRRGMDLPFPRRWHCTADLMAYIQAPRSLAGAAREMLRTSVSKVTRDEMKGQDYRKLPPARQRAVQEYARSDALLCWMLWRNHNREWPEHERWLSEHTTRMGLLDGIGLDLAEVESGLDKLKTVLWEAERGIPWAADHPITSIPRLHRACRDAGIPPPVTTDAKSEEFDIWADEYAERAPFVAAVQKWRRANRLAKVLEAMRVRYVDGRLRYQLKYCGACHTKRWAGDAGMNLQNLPRKGFEGVDLRSCLVPKPGHVFVSSDLSQIEARVLLWLAEDDRMLARLRTGEDLYESHARVTMGYTDPRPLSIVDPDKRQFAKCRCLSADTLVLTERGYVPIIDVRLSDRVWDGVEWVTHSGVVCNGFRPTTRFYGDRYTDDHELFVGERETIQAAHVLGGGASRVAGFRSVCASRNEVRFLARAVAGVLAECGREAVAVLAMSLRVLWDRAFGCVDKPETRENPQVHEVFRTRKQGTPGHPEMGENPG